MYENYKKILEGIFNPETGEFNSDKAKEKYYENRTMLNILVMGATGVGKSTLLNAIFGENVAETGVGQPITQQPHKYTNKEKGLVIWDTKGIEAKDYQNTLDDLSTLLSNAFEESKKSKKIDYFPHVAWLCIKETSSRIEGREFDLLKLTQKHNIPTIVVFTHTQYENGDAFVQEVQKQIAEKGFNVSYVRVNSVAYKMMNRYTVEQSGLDELLEETAKSFTPKHAKELQQVLYRAQIQDNTKRLEAMIDSATSIINKSSVAAGVTGASPIPFSDMFAISAIQTNMIYQINSEFEIELETKTTLSILVGLLAVTGISQFGRIIVSNLLKFIPFAGSVTGSSISGTTAAAITKALGEAYILALKNLYNTETGQVEIKYADDILVLFKTYFVKP